MCEEKGSVNVCDISFEELLNEYELVTKLFYKFILGLELGWGEVVREEWKVWRWLWLGVAHFENHKHPMSGVRMKLAV
jgi:hypothetical protein